MSLFKQRDQRSIEGRPACSTRGAGCAQYVLMVSALPCDALGAQKATADNTLACRVLLVSLYASHEINPEQKSLRYDVDGALLLSH